MNTEHNNPRDYPEWDQEPMDMPSGSERLLLFTAIIVPMVSWTALCIWVGYRMAGC